MLEISQALKSDLDSKVIPLVYLVHISQANGQTIYLATKGLEFRGNIYEDRDISISNLKEQVNIKERTWNINAASFKLSNAPVKAKRFSDLISWQGGGDILNCTIEVFVWSESCYSFDDTLRIYTGRVTECKVNRDIVSIRTEDSFDEYLKNKHLPFAKLGDDYTVPEEYRNVPIPATFGSVKKSPLVISRHPQTQTILMFLPDDIFNGDVTIGGISNLSTALGKVFAEIPQYSEWNYELIMDQDEDGNTINPETFPEWNQEFFDGKVQWVVEGQHIQIKKLFRVQIGESTAEILSEPENLPAHDKLQLKLNREPTAYDLPNWQILSEWEQVGQLRFMGDTYDLLPLGNNQYQLPAPLDQSRTTGRHFNLRLRGLWDCEGLTGGGNVYQAETSGTKSFFEHCANAEFAKTSIIPIPWSENYANKNPSPKWNMWMKNIVFWMLKGYYNQQIGIQLIDPSDGWANIGVYNTNPDYTSGLWNQDEQVCDQGLWSLADQIVNENAYRFIYKEGPYSGQCNHASAAEVGFANRLFRDEFDTYCGVNYNGQFSSNSKAMKNLDGIVIPTNFGDLSVPYYNEFGVYYPNSWFDHRRRGASEGFKNQRYFTWWKPDQDGEEQNAETTLGGYTLKGWLQRDWQNNHGVPEGLSSLICGFQTGTDVWEENYDNRLKLRTLLPIIHKDIGVEAAYSVVSLEHPSFTDPDGNGFCTSFQSNNDVWISRGLNQPMNEMFPSSDPEGQLFNHPSTFKCGNLLGNGNDLDNEYMKQDFFEEGYDVPTIDALANPFGDEAIEVTPMVEMGLGWGPTPVAYNRRHTFRSSYYDWGYGNPGYSDADFWENRILSHIFGRGDNPGDPDWLLYGGWPPNNIGASMGNWEDSPDHQGYLHGDGYGGPGYEESRSYVVARPEYQAALLWNIGTAELLTFDQAQLYALDQGGGQRSRSLIRVNFTFDNVDTTNLLPNSVHTYVKGKVWTDYDYNYNEGDGLPFCILTYFTGDELGVRQVLGSTGNITSDQSGTFQLGENAGDFNFDENDGNLLKHFDPKWKTPNSRSELTLDFTFSPIDLGDDAEIFITSTLSELGLEQTVLIEKIAGNKYFADTIGRTDQNVTGSEVGFFTGNALVDFPYDYLITRPCDILFNLMYVDLGYGDPQDPLIDLPELSVARSNHGSLNFNMSLNKEIKAKDFFNDLGQQSKCIPRFKASTNRLGFINFLSTYNQQGAVEIDYRDVIKYKYSRTKLDDVILKCRVLYDWNYNTEKLDKATNDPKQGAVPDNVEDYIGFYNIKNLDNHYLELKAPYITTETSATQLRNFIIEQYKNVHLKIELELPLSYIHLECGDSVYFNNILGYEDIMDSGEKPYDFYPYGLDYIQDQYINGQKILPVFMVTSVEKTLTKIKLSLWQLHELDPTLITQGDEQLVIPDLIGDYQTDTLTHMLGDVNMDGYVDVLDIVLMVNAILNDDDIGELQYVPEGP